LQAQAGGLVEAEREIGVLNGLPGRALAEVVECADDDRRVGRIVCEHAELGRVGALDARELGRDTLGEHPHDRARRGCLREQRADSGVRLHVTGGEQPAAHGEQVRHEADREAELLRDLRCVPVGADGVRREVLEHGARMR